MRAVMWYNSPRIAKEQGNGIPNVVGFGIQKY